MTWADDARKIIREGTKDLPADIPLKERTAFVRKLRPWQWDGMSWPYKAWCKAQREYLAQFQPKPNSQTAIPLQHLSPLERLMSKEKQP